MNVYTNSAIANTDPISKGGNRLIKLQDGSFFLFDSLGLLRFSGFILDEELISKFFKNYHAERERYTYLHLLKPVKD